MKNPFLIASLAALTVVAVLGTIALLRVAPADIPTVLDRLAALIPVPRSK